MSRNDHSPRHAARDLVIDAEGLVKTFGSTRALDGFDLRTAAGEVHGFLGPNGAGKSTTIRALLGQLRLDAGHCHVLGRDAWVDSVSVHERIAYVPGDVALWEGLSGGECIDVLVSLQGGGERARRDQLVERFDLDPTKRTRSYSKGNRQKVALIAAFAKDADLYLLDEPTSGLDPLMEEAFQVTVREVKEAGRSVLLSSHILSEVEKLCDRVTIIRKGATVMSGSLEELRGRSTSTVVATTRRPPEGLQTLDGLTNLRVDVETDQSHATFHCDSQALGTAVDAISRAEVLSLTVEPPSLDDVFLSTYAAPEAGQEPGAPETGRTG